MFLHLPPIEMTSPEVIATGALGVMVCATVLALLSALSARTERRVREANRIARLSS